MKIFLLSLLILFLLTGVSAQNINIPESNFRQALIDLGIDGGDEEISETEAEAVTSLNVGVKNISDLSGIQYFTNLQTLICNYNQLKSLDVSDLTNLKVFYCGNNQLKSLDVSGLTNLKILSCGQNQLGLLDVKGLTNLVELNCSENQLTSLDVKGLTNLESLSCARNRLTSLDVSGLTNLSSLFCYDNQLTFLDVSALTSLVTVHCHDNQLRSIDIRTTPALIDITAYNNPDLECIVVDDVMEVPFIVQVDQDIIPYSTEPCLATFEGLDDLIGMTELPHHITNILTLSLDKAEWLCSTGSAWLVQLTLEGMKQTLIWSARYGQISTTVEEQLTMAIEDLMNRIRNGELDCDGESSFTGVFDWIFDLFFLEQWEDQQEDSTDYWMAGKPEATYRTDHSRSAVVYPNPTQGLLRISAPAEQVVVLDMVGKRLLEAEGTDEIDLSGLQAGVHVIRLEAGQDVSLHRVVKQR